MIIVSSIFILSFFCYSCCGVFPVPPSTNFYSRGPIDEETLSFVQMGIITKEDVLLKLGNPTFCSNNDDSLEYCWPKFYGGLLWGVQITRQAGVIGIGKAHCVSLEFDEHGILKKYEVKRNLELQSEHDWQKKPLQCSDKEPHVIDRKQPDVAK